jgi:hypothetical protein
MLAQPADDAYVPDSALPDQVPVQVLMHGLAKARATVNAEPLSVPVRLPLADVVAPGPVFAKKPVIDDPDWLSVSWKENTLPEMELTLVPTHVPVMDDGLLGLGPQPLATARKANSATNGRIATRRCGMDMESPSLVTWVNGPRTLAGPR